MKKLIINLMLALTFVSCEEQPMEIIYHDFGKSKGVFITCEGNFMYGNASLSFYDKEKKQVYNQIFYSRNNAPLGDVAQSLFCDGKTLFIVVNNSGKIYGIDPETAAFRNVITGMTSPRYIHWVNPRKAYVSDLYARKIWIINPETFNLSGNINTSDGKLNSGKHTTEQFVQLGNRIFVSCWSYDEYLLVINPDTDLITDSLKVPVQPRGLVADRHGKIWALSDGGLEGTKIGFENPALTRIDPETMTIEQIYRFDRKNGIPSNLVINSTKDTLLYIYNGIWRMPVKSIKLPDKSFINANGRLFFSMVVDPELGEIYAADAIDYAQNALVYRYSASGAAIDSFSVGINPGGYWFN